MAEPPVCYNYRNGTCERSDVVVLAEDGEIAKVYCRTCKSLRIVTFESSKQAARYRIEKERREKIERDIREREKKPIYFT